MRKRRHGFVLMAAVAALAVLVGAGSALAHGGKGGVAGAVERMKAKSAFEAEVAERLGVTVATLRAAIETAADARIDAAVKAGEITKEDGQALKERAARARLALPADVAKALGISEETLTRAYVDARKAQAKARVDRALAAGTITNEAADRLKQRIDEAPATGRMLGKHGLGPGKGFGFGLRRPAAQAAA